MQISKTIHGDPWHPELHARAYTRVEHPLRQYRYNAGLNFDVHDATTRTLLAVMSSRAAAVIRMPRIVNFDLLPDMGRMTA